MPEAREGQIELKVNERSIVFERGVTAREVRQALKPAADLLIVNGFPCLGEAQDAPLRDGDEVILIRRGEIPPAEELEALMVARHGPGVHDRIKDARVGIAGCGGLGSAVATALARTGVGALVLVDFDVVEPSNLNRQQFFVDQIGLPKVEALAANLSRINPYVTIETHQLRLTRDNIPEILGGCDALAECFDDPAMKRDMTLTVRRRMSATPLVTVSGIAGYGPAGAIRVRKVFNNIFLVGDAETAARPGCGLLAPRVAVAAGHQANLILRLLLGENCDEDAGLD